MYNVAQKKLNNTNLKFICFEVVIYIEKCLTNPCLFLNKKYTKANEYYIETHY